MGNSLVFFWEQSLAERRRHCEADPLVWTNQHFVQWARSIDLTEYAENLKGRSAYNVLASTVAVFYSKCAL